MKLLLLLMSIILYIVTGNSYRDSFIAIPRMATRAKSSRRFYREYDSCKDPKIHGYKIIKKGKDGNGHYYY